MVQTLIPFLFIAIVSVGQAQTKYLFKKVKYKDYTELMLRGETDSLAITSGIRSRSTINRKIMMMPGEYNIVYNKQRKVDEVVDLNHVVVATTKGFYDITLPDGTFYDHINTKGESWQYLLNGKPVMEGKLVNGSQRWAIIVTALDPGIQGIEIVSAMTKVFGIERIRAKEMQPVYIGIGVAAGLATFLTSLNQPDVPN